MFGYWRKPDLKKWKPVCNTRDDGELLAFTRAARKIGVTIKFDYPVPTPDAEILTPDAKGVYILRTEADKAHKLVATKFDEWNAQQHDV